MPKSADAFRTISEVADWLGVQAHVLRFWESKFTQVKPIKRAGGRRYYRPADMLLLGGIQKVLHEDGLTIKGAQKMLREKGIAHVAGLSRTLEDEIGVADSASKPPIADAPMMVDAAITEALEANVVNFAPPPAFEDPASRPSLTEDAVVMPNDDGDTPAPPKQRPVIAPTDPEVPAQSTATASPAPSNAAPLPEHEPEPEGISPTSDFAPQTADEATSGTAQIAQANPNPIADPTVTMPESVPSEEMHEALHAAPDAQAPFEAAEDIDDLTPAAAGEPETAPESEPEAEHASPRAHLPLDVTEAQDGAQTPDPLPTMPAFIHRTRPPSEQPADENAPEQSAPQEPDEVAPTPKPLNIEAADPPYDDQIETQPSVLAQLAKTIRLSAKQSADITPVLAQLAHLRDQMLDRRKE